MKLPIYFEAFGAVGITVSFVAKDKNTKEISTVSMMLCECPDLMRSVVNNNSEHFRTKNSGYQLKNGKYVLSKPIKV